MTKTRDAGRLAAYCQRGRLKTSEGKLALSPGTLFRFSSVFLLLSFLPAVALGQLGTSKVTSIQIQHVGPASVSDELVRANIRVKPGDIYFPAAVDDDVRNLYTTGLFYNVRVASSNSTAGLVLTYIVQGNPRLTEIRLQGNKRIKDSKLRKTITSKVGEPFNERKLFTDTQELQKLYQKKGYPRTEVKYSFSIDENTGRAVATFDIKESPKVKIKEVDFVGANAFKPKKLRKVIKTRKRWMFSWITGSGVLKDEQFEEDKEKLADFYRNGTGKAGEGGYRSAYAERLDNIRLRAVEEGSEYHCILPLDHTARYWDRRPVSCDAGQAIELPAGHFLYIATGAVEIGGKTFVGPAMVESTRDQTVTAVERVTGVKIWI